MPTPLVDRDFIWEPLVEDAMKNDSHSEMLQDGRIVVEMRKRLAETPTQTHLTLPYWSKQAIRDAPQSKLLGWLIPELPVSYGKGQGWLVADLDDPRTATLYLCYWSDDYES